MGAQPAWTAALCGLWLGACGAGGEAVGDSALAADMAGLDAPEAWAPCVDDPASWPDGGTCLSTVSGQVVDESGAPLDHHLVSVCADECFFARTDASGRFLAEVRSHLRLSDYAILVHGRPDRASYYVHLPPATGDAVVMSDPMILPLLPTSGPEIPLDSAAHTVTDGEVTLSLSAGTQVQLDVEDVVILPLGGLLRVRKIDDPRILPFVDALRPPVLLYGIAPFEATFSNKVSVSFSNAAGLAPGTAVDVFQQRSLINEVAPAGALERVASAHVSTDGTRIDCDPGEGITILTWLAVAPAP